MSSGMVTILTESGEHAVAGAEAQADFWQRVDSLGERRYYARVDVA